LKLTIELVPRSCWFSNLRSELSALDWKRLKIQTYQAAGWVCEICGGKGKDWPVECHERWLYDDLNHIQKLEGLIALCPACHEVKHIGLAEKRGHLPHARQHLAKINGISLADAMLYIEHSFEVWAQRSCHQWKLDISWLASQGIEVPKETRR
jgi:hypothetical protein